MRGGQDGFILPTALLAVLAMAIIVMGGYALTRAQVRETVYELRQAQAQEIAQAGLEDALNKLNLNTAWKTGYNKKAFAGGFYTVSISTDQDPWVTSTGYSASIAGFGRAARTVKARALFDGLYNFADSTFTVTWAMTAFDSAIDRTPTCRTSNMNTSGCKTGAHVWANTSVVTTAGAVRINGDALYAEDTSTAPAAATVSGKVVLAASSATVLVEDGSPYLTLNDNNATRISPISAYNPATMVLSSTGTDVTLSSGTFYFKGMNISSHTLFINLPSSSYEVRIYLDGYLYVNPTGEINTSNFCGGSGGGCRAYNVHVYGQGGSTITLSGYTAVANTDNTTYIDLYCPQDDIVINQRVLGRAVGRTVRIQNPYGGSNSRPVFFFDLQFGYTAASGTRWVSGSWSENYYQP